MTTKKGKVQRKTILFIDDHPQFIRGIKRLLTQRGYFVISAATGQEAFDRIKTKRPNMVLLDLFFRAGVDGLDLLRQFKSDPNMVDVPVVAFGEMCDSPDYEQEARSLGAKACLITSELSDEEFADAVERVLNHDDADEDNDVSR